MGIASCRALAYHPVCHWIRTWGISSPSATHLRRFGWFLFGNCFMSGLGVPSCTPLDTYLGDLIFVRNSSEALLMVLVWELLHVGSRLGFLTAPDGTSSPSETHLRRFGWFLFGNCFMSGLGVPSRTPLDKYLGDFIFVRNSFEALRMVFVWELLHVGLRMSF